VRCKSGARGIRGTEFVSPYTFQAIGMNGIFFRYLIAS
jgi:hypothetical protein